MRAHYFILSGALFMMLSFTVNGQEVSKPCDAKYEVDAGPDIDVCQGGIVGLSGLLGGDAVRGVWRGGKGVFTPDRNVAQVDYTPDSSEYGKTIVLTFVGDNPKFPDCPKGRDDVQLRVNLQPKVTAGKSGLKICQGKPLKLDGRLLEGNAKRLEWSSNGAGTFDDPAKPDAIFTPHEVDGAVGSVILTFKAIPYGVCLPDSDLVEVRVLPAPLVKLPVEMKSSGGAPVTIEAKVSGEGRLNWSSTGNGKFSSASRAVTMYSPSEEDRAAGKVTIRLKAQGQKGCDAQAEMQLLFK